MAHAAEKYTQLSVPDSTTMAAYVSRPRTAGRHPGVIVFQEAYGVNGHIRDIADRFSREGFTAVAPELFHRTAPGFEGVYGDFESTRKHISALTDQTLEADIRAAYDWLEHDRQTDGKEIVTIGFCMGGRVSFIADALLPLRAAVSFYGGGIAQSQLHRTGSLQGPILMFWGGSDKHILPEHVRAVENALRAANKVFTSVTISDAGHGFFCEERESYNERAAVQAWAHLRAFLKFQLKQK